MALKSLLGKIHSELKERDGIREIVRVNMRRTTQLSKQSIHLVHQKRFDEAKRLLEDASKLLAATHEASNGHPDLFYSGVVNSAFEEYTEARCFLALIEKGGFVSHKELGVSPVPYVLGLADVIGELRRETLDFLREGNLKAAEGIFQIMEHIYVGLMALDDVYFSIAGLRRKCDVARRLIEVTRGEITLDSRRSSLEAAIKKLTTALEAKDTREKGQD